MDKMWKEAVMALFKVLQVFQHFPGRTEENHKKP
jgi:hypothetical protein